MFLVFPKEPQRTDSASMQDTYRPFSKHYHLQNVHNKGFELTVSSTNDARPLNERFTKKQHFIQGRVCISQILFYSHNDLLKQDPKNSKIMSLDLYRGSC